MFGSLTSPKRQRVNTLRLIHSLALRARILQGFLVHGAVQLERLRVIVLVICRQRNAGQVSRRQMPSNFGADRDSSVDRPAGSPWSEPAPAARRQQWSTESGIRNNRQKLPKRGDVRRFAQIAVTTLCAQTVSSYL